MIKKQSWKQLLIYDSEYDSPALQALLKNPDEVFHILKNDTTTTLWKRPLDHHMLIIKRYNIKGFWHALKRGLLPSRAIHCWRNARYLLQCGIATPRPVAIIEKRFGPWRSTTYFINEYVPGINLINSLPATKDIINDMLHILKRFGECGITHGDLKPENILIADHKIVLLDLDSMRIHKKRSWWFKREHQKDVDRINREFDIV